MLFIKGLSTWLWQISLNNHLWIYWWKQQLCERSTLDHWDDTRSVHQARILRFSTKSTNKFDFIQNRSLIPSLCHVEKLFILSYVLLCIYWVSGTVLGTGKRIINRTKSLISLRTGYYETINIIKFFIWCY